MSHDCDTVRDRLFEHAEDRLPPAERDRIDRELAVCASCRQDLESIRALHGTALRWADEAPPPELRRSLPAGFAGPARPPSGWRDPWRAISAAAVVVLALIMLLDVRLVRTEGGLLLTTGPAPPPAAPATGVPSPVPAGPGPDSGRPGPDAAYALRTVRDRDAVAAPLRPAEPGPALDAAGAALLATLLRAELERRDELAEAAIARLLRIQLRQERRLNDLSRRLRDLGPPPDAGAGTGAGPGAVRLTTEPEGAPL